MYPSFFSLKPYKNEWKIFLHSSEFIHYHKKQLKIITKDSDKLMIFEKNVTKLNSLELNFHLSLLFCALFNQPKFRWNVHKEITVNLSQYITNTCGDLNIISWAHETCNDTIQSLSVHVASTILVSTTSLSSTYIVKFNYQWITAVW